ncbi:MAG: HlyC/CorC family transporter [Betaproteobacteria bacterium]|nr:HlyC/CorC family transporter [Betaproteobacteria bacterium]
MDEIPLAALYGALAVLLIISGFFSISETSMMALNRYRLRHLAKQGHTGARVTTALLAKTDRLLGVILLGNNLVNAASALLVGEIVRRSLGDSELALAVATGAVTFAILVFAEITPKVVAAAYPERIALPSSFVLAPLLRVLHPVVWFINLFVKALLWLTRLKPEKAVGHTLTMEELRTLVLEESHFIPKKHRSILLNLFDLESITVDDVMTPRNHVEAIDLDSPDEAIRKQIGTCYHTRLPVYQGELNNVVGIVHVRKVLNLLQGEEFGAEALKQVLAEPYFIPGGTPLFSQLQLFQENQKRIGLVVDEYGELMGLVTLEDILEEIIGEFTTHSPAQSGSIVAQEDGSWLVEGSCLLREINRKLGIALPVDGPKTLNGLIVEHLQDIPEAGTSLKIANHPMEIVQTQDRVVKVVKVFPPLRDAA